jgi:ATP phosphoribosyltransferase
VDGRDKSPAMTNERLARKFAFKNIALRHDLHFGSCRLMLAALAA